MGFLGMAASFEDYKLNTVTSMHFGIGKTFGKYHTVRLSLAGGTGYEEYSKKRFYMAHGKADYLFNMTAFSRGYDPARHFEVSLLLGGGAMYTKLQKMSKRVSPEFHGGLQFKFVAGPYGHFIVEPYAGITQDKMAASSDKNWRRYDIFYGVNLGIVHNLTNNYAPRQRADSLRRAGLDGVGNEDVSFIAAVHGNQHAGTRFFCPEGRGIDAEMNHQLFIAAKDGFALCNAPDAHTGQLLQRFGGRQAQVPCLCAGSDAGGDGVGGALLTAGAEGQCFMGKGGALHRVIALDQPIANYRPYRSKHSN